MKHQEEKRSKSKSKKSRSKKLFFIFLSILAVWIVLIFSVSRYLSKEERVPNRNTEIDAIIVVSGGDVRGRTEEGIKTFVSVKNENTKLIFSGNVFDNSPSNAEWMRDFAISKGINPDEILVETKAVNTFENAKFSKQILSNYDIKNIIVVTSPYHIRRTQVTFDEVFGDDYEIFYLSTDECFFDCASDYFSFHQYFRLTSESAKLFYYGVTGDLD